MLKAWVEAGLEASRFWPLTYREIGIILEGARNRIIRERNDQMSLAWHIEALHRSKKLPRLKEMLRRAPAAAKKAHDWESQFAAFSAWAGSFRKDAKG